jgi:hypothetical protein
MSQIQYSLVLPENCNTDNWMDSYFSKNDDYISSDEDEYSDQDSDIFSNLSYTKQLGSLNLDSYDEYECLSPRPLFRMNALNEYCPPFETQMEKKYQLKKGTTYRFVEYYPLLYSNTNIKNSEIKTKKIIGIFDEFVNIDIFRFIVNGIPYLTNRRNFEKNIFGYNWDYEEVSDV